MGTPEFAVASLDILVENNYNVVGVITVPDKPAGRGLELQQSAVKKYALAKGLNILQPEKLKDESFLADLKVLQADLQVVVAFRMLPEVVWNMPAKGTFNLHASLLPQYRGAAPINWAVINGEKTTGATTFFLQHQIDTGKIIFRHEVPIKENETAGELHDALMVSGAGLVLKTIQAIEQGNYPQVEQSDLLNAGEILKSAPKIFKENCRINFNQPSEQVHNFIRGLSPYPTAFTELISPEGTSYTVKIFSTTKEVTSAQQAGNVFSDGKQSLAISTNNGLVHIHELQLSGRRKMSTQELLRGFAMAGQWRVTGISPE